MIDSDEVIRIHNLLIDEFGGSRGVRDYNLLDSAINRPFQTFDKKDLYSTPIDKSAAIFQSLIINHPFIDGNKRIAYVLMRLILLQYNLDLRATQDEKYDFVIKAASGEMDIDSIKDWIFTRIIQK
jgi:death on curing protein